MITILSIVTRKAHYDRTGPRTIETRQFKNFQKENFLFDLEQMPWNDISLYSNPDDMWNVWRKQFITCVDKHAPLKRKRIRNKKSPWITRELLSRMHKRDYLKKKAVSTNDQAIWEQYKHARNQANNAIKLARKRYFCDNLEISKGNPRETWKLINELSSRKSSESSNISEIQVGNQSINSSVDMAEAFNKHFTDIGHNLAREIPATDIEPEYYIKPTDKTFSLQTPSVDTVYKLLTKMNDKKAAGLDRIPCKLLKMAASIVAPSLTGIFEKSIHTGIFPTEWKLARVTPVFKKGIKSDLNNYRPISVIPVVSKVFEKIIYDQLYEYLNDNKLLSDCQSGFRSLHSTLTALLEATNSWSVNIDNGLLNGVVFIDPKKAFDTIDHEIIVRKMSYFGADHNTLKWFQSYLGNRSQMCNVNGNLSTARTITCGVPQGSILGPLLFLMYINDLPNCLQNASSRMFADDTNISLTAKTLTELKLEINPELSNLNRWLKANKLSLNVAKTELMIIGSRQRLDTQSDEIDIEIDGEKIKRVDHTKSLGLVIDDRLSWSKHVEEISRKVSSSIGALKRVRSFISINTAVQIYNALILPHFDYCSPVSDCLSSHLSDTRQKLQNRAARVITKSPYHTSSSLLLNKLKREKLSKRRQTQKTH